MIETLQKNTSMPKIEREREREREKAFFTTIDYAGKHFTAGDELCDHGLKSSQDMNEQKFRLVKF